MVWKTAEKKIIGTVVLEEEGVTPKPPTPTPTPKPVPQDVKDFMTEHKRLQTIVDRDGCINRAKLMAEGKITNEKRMDQHLQFFEDDDAISEVDKETDAYCSGSAISDLRKRLEVK